MTDGARLIGTWRLITMETQFEDGTVEHSYGENCDGRLHYGADGRMSAHLWDPGRHTRTQVPEPDPVYFSYTGAWTLNGKVMQHRVDAATNPDWTGTTVTRDVVWDGEDLLLTAAVEFGGRAGMALLKWRKLPVATDAPEPRH